MIILENINKHIENKKIFTNLNFQFNDFTNYLIKGDSGVGKTTLLNIIAGYTNIDSGNIHFSKNQNKVAYLFQDILLYSNLSVKQNLFIKFLSINNNSNLEDFTKCYKEILHFFKIENLLDNKICTLSGGEKRRVELAQIFIDNPSILLLDEPTSSLDKKNKINIINIIDTLFPNIIKVVVSHDEESIFKNYEHLRLTELRGLVNE